MRKILIIFTVFEMFSLLGFSQIQVNLKNCENTYDSNDTKNYIDCIDNICNSEPTPETQMSCINYNQFSSADSFRSTIINKVREVESQLTPCQDDSLCISKNMKCFEIEDNEMIDIIDSTSLSFLRTIPKHIYGTSLKLNGATCYNHSECHSSNCKDQKCSPRIGYCRKAKFGEIAISPVVCEDGLIRDTDNKCIKPVGLETNKLQETIDEVLAANHIDVCNPDSDLIKNQYQSAKMRQFALKAFEIIFGYSNTSDPLNIQNELRNVAKSITESKQTIIKKLNSEIDYVRVNAQVLKTALESGENSQRVVNFLGTPIKESDLYKESVRETNHIAVLKYLEDARANYNKEMSELYFKLSSPTGTFGKLTEDYMKINENNRFAVFNKKTTKAKTTIYYKNKHQWNYRAKIDSLKDNTDLFSLGEAVLKERRFEEIITEMYLGFRELIPHTDKTTKFFYDYPMNLDYKIEELSSSTPELINKNLYTFKSQTIFQKSDARRELNNLIVKNLELRLLFFPIIPPGLISTLFGGKKLEVYYSSEDNKDKKISLNPLSYIKGYVTDIRYLKTKRSFIKDLEENYRQMIKYHYESSQLEKRTHLIDPDFSLYQGCFDNSFPETSTSYEKYCKNIKKTEEHLLLRAIAGSLIYSGNNDRPRTDNGFFGGKVSTSLVEKNPENRYAMFGPRGSYIKYINETLYSLYLFHKNLYERSSERFNCIKTPETGSTPPSYFRSEDYGSPFGAGTITFNSTSNLPSITASSNIKKSTAPLEPFNKTSAIKTKSSSSSSSPIANSSSLSSPIKTASSSGNVTDKNDSDFFVEKAGNYKKLNKSNNKVQSSNYNNYYDSGDYSRSISSYGNNSLSKDDKSHILKNLKDFKANKNSRATIFEDISETYVQKIYPRFFSE